MTMTSEEKMAIATLRDSGHVVVIFTPEEVSNLTSKSIKVLEDCLVETGNEVIGDLARMR